ncbi:hypothetical protein BU17DRAFT_38540 [Hysterangium stoloniferum]|nr:hypothetical protein BU17DRAFT_38540 [Hysterangium stoloniferum]
MLQVPSSPVPSISISFAPNQIPPVEPKSPFVVSLPAEPESPRPQHLLPPPTLSPNQLLHTERYSRLSPLSPASSSGGKGMERARFEAMLKASKERSAMTGSKKAVDLRKELAVKAQMTKQMERRARFLCKLAEPPSPSAADVPVTPPESPAIFHFSLPSPGLESPIEIFEDVNSHPELYETSLRIEQVDFRLPRQKEAAAAAARRSRATLLRKPASPLPSLDQISQRMNKNPVTISTTRAPSCDQESAPSNRLPSFLRARSPSPPASQERTDIVPQRKEQIPRRSLRVLPDLVLHGATKPIINVVLKSPSPVDAKENIFPISPPSPKSPRGAKLQITTTICPPISSKSSPTEFTKENIMQLASSEPHKTCPSVLQPVNQGGVKPQDDISSPESVTSEEKLRRRTSAPAEIPGIPRGERHPVLNKPGGF